MVGELSFCCAPPAAQALYADIVQAIQDGINAAGSAMQSASSALEQGETNANATLQAAKDKLANATSAVAAAQAAFQAAQQAVSNQLVGPLPGAVHVHVHILAALTGMAFFSGRS